MPRAALSRSDDAVRRPCLVPGVRFSSGIKILEDGKAAETLYWHQEDEKLLKKMIKNNPELDPAFSGIAGFASDASCSTTEKVKLLFMKHGIPPVNKA